MTFKKNKWNHDRLENILDEKQLSLLEDWIRANGINPESIEYEDDLLNGVRIWGRNDLSPAEPWEIDFVEVKR